jgi:hypothetical protein
MKHVNYRWWLLAACVALQGCALFPGPVVGEVVIRAEGNVAPLACVVPGSASPQAGDRIYAERRLRPVAAIPSARRRTVSASGEIGSPAGDGCWTYTGGVGRFVAGQRASVHRDG